MMGILPPQRVGGLASYPTILAVNFYFSIHIKCSYIFVKLYECMYESGDWPGLA